MKLRKRNILVPSLWRSHPNFFIIYFITAVVLHLGMACSQYIDAEGYTNIAFAKLYNTAPVFVWATLSLIVFGLMTVGAYYKFHIYGRIGLSLGLFVCLSRGLLIQLAPKSGGAFFVWFTLSVLHFAQLSEPSTNPLTAKE